MREWVRVRALSGFESYVDEQGGRARTILSRLGLTRRQLSDPEGWIPLQSVLRAFEMAARELATPDFGYRLSKYRDFGFLGPVFVAARHSPDARSALECLTRYFGIQNTGVRFTLTVEAGRAVRGYHVNSSLRKTADQWIEESLTTFPVLLEALSGREPRVSRILMRHAPNRSIRIYRQQFGAEVLFNQAIDAVEFDADILDCPQPYRDAQLHGYLRDYLESRLAGGVEDIEIVVATVLETLIPAHQGRIEAVSEQLGLHPRALQRRLKARGLKFADILDERRRLISERLLLKGGMPLGEIAAHVGYSEQSAFNHAFRRWRGMAPGDWLERHAEP